MTVDSMKLKLDAVPLVTQLPLGHGRDFKGIIDLLSMDICMWNTDEDGSTFSRIPLVKPGVGGVKDYTSVHSLLGSKMEFEDLPVSRDDIKCALDYRSSLAEQVRVKSVCMRHSVCACV